MIPLAVFLAGWLRGNSFGNAWAKVVTVNLPILLLMLGTLRGTTLLDTAATILGAWLVIVLCSAAGIWLRRRRINQVGSSESGDVR